jgi:ATP-dependent DNA helicase PIF1
MATIEAKDGYYTSADHMVCNPVDFMNIYFLDPLMAGCYQDDDPVYATSEFNNFNRVDGFDSDLWNNDERFDDLLKSFRWGVVRDLELIEKMKQNTFNGLIKPTKLFSKNKDVDAVNQYELGLLLKETLESFVYKVIYPDNPIKLIESTKYSMDNKVQEYLTLCVGAQVMVTRNLEQNIVNGTRGIVIGLTKTSVTIQLTNGELYNVCYFHVKPDPFETNEKLKKIDFKYLPLTLSWAMSIHKSQGATIDLLEVDLGDSIFACGQAYVALSRAKNSDSVRITNFNPRSVKVSKSVLAFYDKYN